MRDKIDSLEKDRGKGTSPTALYGDISTMRHFHLSPDGWRVLSRQTRRALHLWRMMEYYHNAFSPEAVKMRQDAKDAKAKRREQEFLKTLPRLGKRR